MNRSIKLDCCIIKCMRALTDHFQEMVHRHCTILVHINGLNLHASHLGTSWVCTMGRHWDEANLQTNKINICLRNKNGLILEPWVSYCENSMQIQWSLTYPDPLIHLSIHLFGNHFTFTYPEIQFYERLAWERRCPDKCMRLHCKQL